MTRKEVSKKKTVCKDIFKIKTVMHKHPKVSLSKGVLKTKVITS